MTNEVLNGTQQQQLRQIIEKIETLEAAKEAIQGDIKEEYDCAKGEGYNVKVLRQIVRMRKLKREELIEMSELTDLYAHALGMKLGA